MAMQHSEKMVNILWQELRFSNDGIPNQTWLGCSGKTTGEDEQGGTSSSQQSL